MGTPAWIRKQHDDLKILFGQKRKTPALRLAFLGFRYGIPSAAW